MTKEINTDAELIGRLLTTRPTPAECLVSAARIEQLTEDRDRLREALRDGRRLLAIAQDDRVQLLIQLEQAREKKKEKL